MATDSGYSNQKKLGLSQFETVHNLGSSNFGKPIAQKCLYDLTAQAGIVSVTEIKEGGKVTFLNIEFTAHGAQVGDVLRMVTGTLIGWEFPIERIIDANNIYVLPTSSSLPIAAEDAKIMRWITVRGDSNGSQTVVATPGPSQFVLDGVDTEVEEDTTTPANNKPMPVKDKLVQAFTGVKVSLAAADNVTPLNIVANTGAKRLRKIQIFMNTDEAMYIQATGANDIVSLPGGNGIIDFDCDPNASIDVLLLSAPVDLANAYIIINGWY